MAPSSISLTDSSTQTVSSRAVSPVHKEGDQKTAHIPHDKISQNDKKSDIVSIGPSDKEAESLTYSPTGLKKTATQDDFSTINDTEKQAESKTEETDNSKESSVPSSSKTDDTELNAEELKKVSKLQSRDKEVKAHEQAHIAAGGQYVRGGAHFEYETGPDGEKYAVGGEVSIDVSKVSDDPKATITKMQTVIRAALAPANPSSQDRSVASQATRIESESRAQAFMSSSYAQTSSTSDTDKQQTTNPSGESPSGTSLKIDQYA